MNYSASPGLEVCGGTHLYVDDFIPFLANELGISTVRGLRYSWLDERDFGKSGCVGDLLGCATGAHSFAKAPAVLHELVHNLTGASGMNHWPFFTEGVAVAYDPFSWENLGPRYLRAPPGSPLPDPRTIMAATREQFRDAQDAKLNYWLAGSFVAFLLSRHGPARFVSLTQQIGTLDEKQSLDELRGLFDSIYDLDLDSEAELFMIGSECAKGSFPVLPYDCAMPEVAWSEDSIWMYTKALDCAADDVVGGNGSGRSWASTHSIVLDVPSGGPYELRLSSENPGIMAQIGACFGCPWELNYATLTPGPSVVVELDAGLHYLRIQGDSAESSDVQVTVARASAL